MKRRSAGWIAVAALLVAPGVARADEEIHAGPPNRYTTPEVTMDQGEPLTFVNSDVAAHDVTHRADRPLFRSEIIGQGESAFVEGSQYLTAGTYEFFCSVHPQMVGTLTVTGAGAPKPRPGEDGGGGGPAPADEQEPAVALELGRPKARRVKRSRALRLLVGADEAARLTVTVSIGARRAGRVRLELGSAGTRRIEVSLSRKARKRVRRGRRVFVVVRAVDAAGNAGRDERSTRLR